MSSRTAVNIDLNDLLGSITHQADYTSNLANPNLMDDVTGARALGKQMRAQGFANIDELGVFTGRRTPATDIIDRIDGLKDLKQVLEDAGGSGAFKRLADSQQRDLSRLAKNIYRDAGKAIREYDAYSQAALDQQGKIITQLERARKNAERAMRAEALTITDQAARTAFVTESTARLGANYKAATEAVMNHFGDIRENAADIVSRLKETTAEVERETGIKAAEHMGLKAAEEGAAKVGSEVAKAGEDMHHLPPKAASHMKHIGIGAVAGAAVGYATASDEKDKGTRAVVGGVLGGIAGKVVGMVMNPVSKVGAVLGGHTGQIAAERMAQQAITHIR